MVGGTDKTPQGRRGGKKARGRAGGGTNGGRSNNNGDNGGGAGAVDGGQSFPVVSDSRFSSMHSAPAFQRVKPDERKVRLDDRFKAVLTDPRFQVSTSKVDRYGRQVDKASKKAKSQLRAFYKVEEDGRIDDESDEGSGVDDEDEEEEGEEEEEKKEGEKEEEEVEEDEEEEEENGEGGMATAEESRQAYLTRLSRGEISGSSSDTSDDDDDDDDDSDEDDEIGSESDVGRAGLDDPSREAIPVSEDTSRRLAVTNCDWDHMRARDLMVLCGSFCPGSARLLSVEVYPSDFGLEMMKVEAAAGPHAALSGSIPAAQSGGHADNDDDDDDEEDEEDEEAASSGDGDGGSGEGAAGGVSTPAGTAVDGRVVRRRRPGVIIEEYRTTGGEDEDDDGDNGEENLDGSGATKKRLPVAGEGNGGGRGNDSKGFDPETLRVYELRKLKYYFAVLECSSVAAAEAIYREVDGMEFEHSSVALDLRFIPDEVSFEGRQVRDKSSSVPSSYQPPSFICKALQQTRVECTWDEAPSERQVLLGRVSQWRDAAEEDFEAYLASSSDDDDSASDDDDDDEKEEGGGGGGRAKKGGAAAGKEDKKAAARSARKLLLRDALGGSSDDDDDDSDASTGGAGGGEPYSGAVDQDRDEGEDQEFTFVPRGSAGAVVEDGSEIVSGGAEGLLARRKAKEALAMETPWEASLRKERERKRARKKAIKERIEAEEADDDEDDGEADGFFLEETVSEGKGSKSSNRKNKNGMAKDKGSGDADGDPAAAGIAGGADDEEEEDRRDYDMHQLAREEKLKGKKLRGKRKRKEAAREKAPGQDFRVDVADERFAALLEGDTRFGIDRTDSSFKDTEGMRSILEERTRRKGKKRRADRDGPDAGDNAGGGRTGGGGGSTSNGVGAGLGGGKKGDLSLLVNKLKTRGLAENGGSGSGLKGFGAERSGSASGQRKAGGQQGADADGADGGGKEARTGEGGGKGRRGKKKRRKS